MYEFPTGVERFQEQLIGYFPAEGAAIRGYVAAVNATRKASGLYFAEKAMPRPVARIAGGLMRAPFLRWAGRTTLEVLRTLTSNDDLIALLTGQWGNYGLPPAQSTFGIHAVVAGRYFNERDDKGELKPCKDRYSHPCDALQYGVLGLGEGRSKKAAEQVAAEQALARFDD